MRPSSSSALLVVAVVVAVVSTAFAQAPQQQAAATQIISTNYALPKPGEPASPPAQAAPKIVPTLASIHPAGAQGPAPKNKRPLPYPLSDDTAWQHQMLDLQKQIEKHEEVLKALDKEVDAGRRHRQKLKHAQKLLHGMVSLHQSENVLSALDQHIGGVKQDIKKLGDAAEEAMRARNELKKELAAEMAKHEAELSDARDKLAKHEKTLAALCGKRAEVAKIVQEWRDFVANLKSQAGLNPGPSSLRVPKLPHPPAEEAVDDASGTGSDASGAGSGSGDDDSGSGKDDDSSVVGDDDKKEKEAEKDDFDPNAVTAKPHEIAATHNGIQELLDVHLPRITGMQAFLEMQTTNRRGLRSRRY